VYLVVMRRAREKFGATVRITFGYRSVVGSSVVPSGRRSRRDQRNPAIIVKPR
jgi:hypothetical protein